jgi:hypothetical protein
MIFGANLNLFFFSEIHILKCYFFALDGFTPGQICRVSS